MGKVAYGNLIAGNTILATLLTGLTIMPSRLTDEGLSSIPTENNNFWTEWEVALRIDDDDAPFLFALIIFCVSGGSSILAEQRAEKELECCLVNISIRRC